MVRLSTRTTLGMGCKTMLAAWLVAYAVAATAAVDADAVSGHIVEATNAFRSEQGRQPLTTNAKLVATARDFAQFMARTDRYGHEADGSEPSARAKAHGYEYCAIGENIAFQYSSAGFATDDLSRALVEGWKNSPEHRRNMLEPGMRETGVGVAQSAKSGRWYAVQLFGLPWSARVTFRVTNDAPANVTYRVADRSYQIAPRVTRTHERCGSAEIAFDWPGPGPAAKVEARDGSRFSIVRDASGDWRVERK
jgi:uncharacterized protein YkwD